MMVLSLMSFYNVRPLLAARSSRPQSNTTAVPPSRRAGTFAVDQSAGPLNDSRLRSLDPINSGNGMSDLQV